MLAWINTKNTFPSLHHLLQKMFSMKELNTAGKYSKHFWLLIYPLPCSVCLRDSLRLSWAHTGDLAKPKWQLWRKSLLWSKSTVISLLTAPHLACSATGHVCHLLEQMLRGVISGEEYHVQDCFLWPRDHQGIAEAITDSGTRWLLNHTSFGGSFVFLLTYPFPFFSVLYLIGTLLSPIGS